MGLVMVVELYYCGLAGVHDPGEVPPSRNPIRPRTGIAVHWLGGSKLDVPRLSKAHV